MTKANLMRGIGGHLSTSGIASFTQEPGHLRGALGFTTTVDKNPRVSSYVLQGQAFDENLRGRVIEEYREVDSEDERIFRVESYEVLPYAVLTGQLTIFEDICRELCSDWLLFEVEQKIGIAGDNVL